MTALAIAVVLVIPIVVLVGLLQLVNALERRRAEVVARQIALTDGIHAELGPVVAPRVRRGRSGRWIAVIAVPPGQPEVALMVELARTLLGPTAEIVLVPAAVTAGRGRRGAAAPPLALSGARG